MAAKARMEAAMDPFILMVVEVGVDGNRKIGKDWWFG